MKKFLLYILLLATAAAPVAAIAAPDDSASSSMATSEPTVKVISGGVEISTPTDRPCDVTIYAITGQVVRHLTMNADSRLDIELAAGCYIVRVDRLSTRVIVR